MLDFLCFLSACLLPRTAALDSWLPVRMLPHCSFVVSRRATGRHAAFTVQLIRLCARAQRYQSSQSIADDMKAQEQAIANMQLAVREAFSAGKLSEAQKRAAECRDAIKEYYGSKHPAYASAVNNLALMHKHMGEAGKAQPLLEEALKCYEATVGKQHASTASVLQNLALLLLSSAEKKKGVERMMAVDEARAYLEEAVATRSKLHGEHSALTATARYQLASAAARQKRWDEAERLCKAAITDLKAAVGEQHPNTGTAVNNLGWILKERGQYHTAIDAYTEALATRTALLGTTHPDTLTTQHNLAECLRAAGREEEAQAIQKAILRAMGEEEPAKQPMQ